jgi:hypothetical protein
MAPVVSASTRYGEPTRISERHVHDRHCQYMITAGWLTRGRVAKADDTRRCIKISSRIQLTALIESTAFRHDARGQLNREGRNPPSAGGRPARVGDIAEQQRRGERHREVERQPPIGVKALR